METETHGLVTIEPAHFANKVIKRLHLRCFKGHRVLVRRYYKRRDQGIDMKLDYCDLHATDRRRKNLYIMYNTILHTTSYDNGSRKLI